MSDTRFKKGQVPWNKGLKGVNGTSETRWKKGNVPHTARPVGYERINRDGHIEIKVEGIGRWFINIVGLGSSIMARYQKAWLFHLKMASAQTVELKI